jgi:hypothetical protein
MNGKEQIMAIENMIGLGTWTIAWIVIAVIILVVAVIMKKRG